MIEKVKRWKWVVDVENEPNLKLLVEYNIKTKKIDIIGQYKYNGWNNFIENNYDYTNDNEIILKYIQETILDLKEAIYNIIELGMVFEEIRLIEFDGDAE